MKHLLILLLVILSFGCKSKQKLVETEKSKTETTTETVIEEKKDEVKTVDSTATKKTETFEVKKNDVIDVIGDESGTITVEEVNTPTGKKTIITGAKNVKLSNTEETLTQTIDELIQLKKQDSITYVRMEIEKINEIQELKRKLTFKEKETGGVAWWWFVVVFIAGGITFKFLPKILRFARNRLTG